MRMGVMVLLRTCIRSVNFHIAEGLLLEESGDSRYSGASLIDLDDNFDVIFRLGYM
jgi:hypothetical protein